MLSNPRLQRMTRPRASCRLLLRIWPALIALPAGAALVAACATPSPSEPAVATLSVAEFARTAEQLKGRTVRACDGKFYEIYDLSDKLIGWTFAKSSVQGYHPVHIYIGSCGATKPKLDRQGCLTGRVARPDGSMNRDNWDLTVSSDVANYNWYLHPLQWTAGSAAEKGRG
jgi:hypothetical protein